MRLRFVIRQVGLLFVVLGGAMAVVALVGLADWLLARDEASERAASLALMGSAVLGLSGGGITWFLAREDSATLGRREALLMVAITWIGGSVFAALPFLGWAHLASTGGVEAAVGHPFLHPVDAWFESMSGLTTTGATILTEIETLPRAMHLWRALTHWLGGLGIVVLFVAVLPTLGAGGKRLVRFEVSGPRKEGLGPSIRETARLIAWIYIGLSLLCGFSYWLLTPMDAFDALCHAMSTVSTGGFSTKNTSIAHWDSPALEWISIVFMLLAGVSFALYFLLLTRRWRDAVRDPELRVYLGMQLVVTFIITASMLGKPIIDVAGHAVSGADLATHFRAAAFATVTIHTGTGFSAPDYDHWGPLAHWLLLFLSLIGGCAGSTAGGIKVVRVWIAFKVMIAELEKAYRPNVVRTIRVGTGVLDADLRLGSLAYLLGFLAVLAIGTALVAVCEAGEPRADMLTTFSACAATLANVGPGFAGVGPSQNYSWLGAPSKVVLTLLMALGRIEFYALLVLLTPRFWRGT